MKKHKFLNDATYLPVTMEQFQALVNELLVPLNEIAQLHCTDQSKGYNGDYMAQIVMSAIHAYKHEIGIVYKSELFESCVNRISCHVTFHVVEEVKKRLQPQQKDADASLADPEADNPEPVQGEDHSEEAPKVAQS
jgi:hypothetical protein